eukprot:TRINITY_DN5198_c0_g1_i1.p1 TRINITY_DN5198_c0_g1~~TRINITY_DN5198_c0_g1_i1.p1  ORF type:complete len:463 (-),score=88.27 TRINITY_DN5198_c0_g1_i1:23-1411(-)
MSKKFNVKVISRDEREFVREKKSDIHRIERNADPSLHPFERAREYVRTLNAVKLDKVFAKPFIAQLEGHTDGIYCMSRNPQQLTGMLSGAVNGEIRYWDLSLNMCTMSIEKAHDGYVRGVVTLPSGRQFLSCGFDKTVKLWNLRNNLTVLRANQEDENDDEEDTMLSGTYFGKEPFYGIDHHRRQEMFCTSSSKIDIWDVNRSEPVQSFTWGADSITSTKFNQVEAHVIASCGSDRSIALYDVRLNTPIRKLIMAMRSNSLSWNPMEAFTFVVANEDHNLYAYDMRNLDKALMVYTDHVSAVLDVDFSPTGLEFATGSYDRTIRIYDKNEPRSKEVYHTKRMQRIFSVKYSSDSTFVLSGSDDTNIRIWKSHASAPLKPLVSREKKQLNYSEKLKDRYGHLPQVYRIHKHRHLPKAILKAGEKKAIMKESQQRKFDNVVKHSKPGSVKIPQRKKLSIVKEME